MNALLVLIAVTLAGAVALAALYLYQSLLAPRRIVRHRIAGSSRDGGMRLRGSATGLRTDLKSRVPLLAMLPLSEPSRLKMQDQLDRAGQPLRVNEYLALRLASALVVGVAGAAVLLVLGSPAWAAAPAAFLGVLVGWGLPRLYVGRAQRKRLKQVEQQLPDALTAIAKSLRAGTGLLQALAYAARETPDPLGGELQAALRDLQLGADPADVFTDMAARVGSPDLDIAVTAIVIQRTAGGNLSEILSNVTNTIRERFALQREVTVLTERQRLTANLIALLPIIVAAAFIGLNPDMGNLLITTAAGRISLAIGLAFELLGLVVIRRLAQIEV